MKSLLFIFASLLLCSLVFATTNPLTGCQGGRAVPNSNVLGSNGVCGYGAWNSPTGAGSVNVASVNAAFFNNGAKCGSCYELTGPIGRVVVTVVDYCPASSPKCGGDQTHFILSNEAFLTIATNASDIIYDLSFREVTCPVSANVGLSFGASANNYYFSVLPYNARVAIFSMAVRGKSWGAAEAMVRTTNSVSFAWNKNQQPLIFPITITMTSEDGEVITTSLSAVTGGAKVDAGAQFSQVTEATADCLMTIANTDVYTLADGTGFAWDDSYSFLLISKETDVTDGSIHVVAGNYGALQFTRLGGFETSYFSHVTFLVKASYDGYSHLRVYLGADDTDATSIASVSNTYTNITIPLAPMNPSGNPVASIVFQNFDTATVDLWFSEIHLIRNTTVPLDQAPVDVIITVTGTTGSLHLTTGTTTSKNNGGTTDGTDSSSDDDSSSNSNSNSNSNEHSNANTLSVATSLVLLVSACFVALL